MGARKHAWLDRYFALACELNTEWNPNLAGDVGSNFAEYVSEFGTETSPAETAETKSPAGTNEGARFVDRKRGNTSEERRGLAVLAEVLLDVRQIKRRNHRIDAFEILSNLSDGFRSAKVADHGHQ